MAEVGVDAECDDRHAESRCRRNQCLTDTARNGGCAAARIEDAERLNHARDRAQETEQRGNRNDRAQIVEIAAKVDRLHRHAVGKSILHRILRAVVLDTALDNAADCGGVLLAEIDDRIPVLLDSRVIDPMKECAGSPAVDAVVRKPLHGDGNRDERQNVNN